MKTNRFLKTLQTLVIGGLLFSYTSCAQPTENKYFEGYVKYKITRTFKYPKERMYLNNKMKKLFDIQIGDTVTVYYKRNLQLHVFNGHDMFKTFINGKTGLEKNIRHGIDTLFVGDRTSLIYKKVNIKEIEQRNIFGHKCKGVEIINKKNVQKFWYSPKYIINPEDYKQLKSLNYYDYYSFAEAVPLYTIEEKEYLINKYAAVEIKRQKLHDTLFILPEFPEKQID